MRQTAYRQGLYPHSARPTQGSKEYTFSAKEGIFNTANQLNVKLHSGCITYKAASINLKHIACFQLPCKHMATGMHECHPIALQFFHNKPFAAKQAGTQPP